MLISLLWLILYIAIGVGIIELLLWIIGLLIAPAAIPPKIRIVLFVILLILALIELIKIIGGARLSLF